MHYIRKKTNHPKIILASTSDRPFFNEIWNEYALECARDLGFEVTLIKETAAVADSHWPELLADADAIITTWNSPCIDKQILCQNHKLKIIGHAAGSVADYVSNELFERNIPVTSANSDMAHAVAEWCLMGGLMGIRKIMNYTRINGRGDIQWPRRQECGSIKNSTIGIWGYGAIAGHLHQMLKPLEPHRFLVCSNHLNQQDAVNIDVEKASLERMFKESDVIFLLNGLNEKTRGMVDRKLLASIKDGAVLVNAGRGQLVDEQALHAELAKNRFIGVFDVFHQEPLPEDDPLMHLPNVILTPHNAGYPSRSSYIATILEEFDRFFHGAPLKHRVHPKKIEFMTINGVKKSPPKVAAPIDQSIVCA
jgi:phosphoglycerate dehydrogenase-like enzyme